MFTFGSVFAQYRKTARRGIRNLIKIVDYKRKAEGWMELPLFGGVEGKEQSVLIERLKKTRGTSAQHAVGRLVLSPFP